MMNKLTVPSGCWRTNSAIALRGCGAVSMTEESGTAMVMGSRVPDARVEHSIEQVNRKIDENVKSGNQHHHALNQRKIVARYTLDEQLSDAVEIEHLLGHDQAADQECEFEGYDGDRGQQRIPQRMARNDQFLLYALRSRSADIVLVQNLE